MAFFRSGGVLPIILILVGSLAIFAALGIGGANSALRAADTVTATVSAVETREERSSSSSNEVQRHTVYLVRVVYPGGTAEQNVSAGFWRELEQGEEIEIRVADGAVEIEPGSTKTNMAFAWVIGAVSLLLGLFLLWSITRKMAQARRLQTQGRAVTATISEQVPGFLGKKLRVSFEDEAGGAREAILPAPVLKAFGSTDPGADHALRYDPADPERMNFQFMLDRLSPRR